MGAGPEIQSGSEKKVSIVQVGAVTKHARACMQALAQSVRRNAWHCPELPILIEPH